MERSKFERLSDKQLAIFCKRVLVLIPNIEDYAGSITEFYNYLRYRGGSEVDKVKAIFGGDMTRIDVEYLYYVLIHNDLSTLPQTIDRPGLIEMETTFYATEDIRIDFQYDGVIPTYLSNNEIDHEYVEELHNDEEINPYDWELISKEERSGEVIDRSFDF